MKRKSDGVKLVRKTTDDFVNERGKPLEVQILRDILDAHRRTLNLVDWAVLSIPSAPKLLVTYYDLYPGGDLSDWTPKKGQESSESFVWYVFQQMADVLAYLHYGYEWSKVDRRKSWQPILHCDMKPANIFLRTPRTKDNKYPELVLGDFGLAKLKAGGEMDRTKKYWSPEPRTTGNTKATDVWALGTTIHQLVHGDVPNDRRPEHPPEQQRVFV